MSEWDSAYWRYSKCQFSDKTHNFDFFGPNLPKNRSWGRNFENLSPYVESTPPRYRVCQFLGKTDNFELINLNLGKLSNYVRYSGSYNVEGIAESWVEAKMSWVELDGVRWRWVHGLAIPFIYGFQNFTFCATWGILFDCEIDIPHVVTCRVYFPRKYVLGEYFS